MKEIRLWKSHLYCDVHQPLKFHLHSFLMDSHVFSRAGKNVVFVFDLKDFFYEFIEMRYSRLLQWDSNKSFYEF